MAIGSIINLGGGGGSLSGKGMIIVDTNTMTVGDKVRVRSVYDVSVTEDKTVATVGTPLYFQVEPYDYYKICMVQTISDVETEIGGEYTTIDVGQTVLAMALNKATLGGIQGILNAHQEGSIIAVGDEVDITVNGSPWTMQVAQIDTSNHAIDFVSKYLYGAEVNFAGSQYNGWIKFAWNTDPNALVANLDSFENAIKAEELALLKVTDLSAQASSKDNAYSESTSQRKVWIPANKEIDGLSYYPPTYPQTQFPIFTTQANRIRRLPDGTVKAYWTRDGITSSAHYAYYVGTTGAMANTTTTTYSGLYVLPCFRLTADS